MHITVYVFNSSANVQATIDCPEIRRTPNEIIRLIKSSITRWKEEDIPYPSIRTYSDTVVNYLGELIDEKFISHTDVSIVVGSTAHRFNEEGVMEAGWPYGIFNYVEYENDFIRSRHEPNSPLTREPIMNNILAKLTMRDWQTAEGDDHHLADLQKQPWALIIEDRGTCLNIEATDPTGIKKAIMIEIEDGNMTALIFGNGESEPLAKIHIADDVVYAAPSVCKVPSMACMTEISHDGAKLTDALKPVPARLRA